MSPITSYGLIKVVSMLGGTGKGILLPKSLFELLPPFLAKYLVATFMVRIVLMTVIALIVQSISKVEEFTY